jgi:endoglucanase
MTKSAPWTIDEERLQRVSDVVDMITDNGLHVLVNVHHDSWLSFDLGAADANYTQYEDKFYSLWYQIGTKLGCKSSMVAFEALNEPAGSTAAHAAELNKLNRIFIKAINDAGGHNSQRVIVLGGLGNNAANTAQWFEPPSSNITNPWAVTFHYYSPWDFVADAWGRTFWGSDADKAAVEADFAAFRGNYSDVPVIVGEFGMEMKPSEPAARWKWFDHVVATGYKYNFTMMLWDASIHFVVDSPEPWQDPTALDILMHAAKGEKNVLAESTVDGSALEQWSSAYLFHRVGEPVTNISLPFIWNGRRLILIKSSSDPQPNYYRKENNITFTADYLSTLFPEDAAPGLKANISLTFSGGARLHLQAVQWDTPQPAMTDFVVNAENANTDLRIPIEYKGLAKLATVKARMYNSTYLFDDWTQWLGPLQQGRLVSPKTPYFA